MPPNPVITYKKGVMETIGSLMGDTTFNSVTPLNELKGNDNTNSISFIGHSEANLLNSANTVSGMSPKGLAQQIASSFPNKEDRKHLFDFYLLSCEAGFKAGKTPSFAESFALEMHKLGFENLKTHAFTPPSGVKVTGMILETTTRKNANIDNQLRVNVFAYASAEDEQRDKKLSDISKTRVLTPAEEKERAGLRIYLCKNKDYIEALNQPNNTFRVSRDKENSLTVNTSPQSPEVSIAISWLTDQLINARKEQATQNNTISLTGFGKGLILETKIDVIEATIKRLENEPNKTKKQIRDILNEIKNQPSNIAYSTRCKTELKDPLNAHIDSTKDKIMPQSEANATTNWAEKPLNPQGNNSNQTPKTTATTDKSTIKLSQVGSTQSSNPPVNNSPNPVSNSAVSQNTPARNPEQVTSAQQSSPLKPAKDYITMIQEFFTRFFFTQGFPNSMRAGFKLQHNDLVVKAEEFSKSINQEKKSADALANQIKADGFSKKSHYSNVGSYMSFEDINKTSFLNSIKKTLGATVSTPTVNILSAVNQLEKDSKARQSLQTKLELSIQNNKDYLLKQIKEYLDNPEKKSDIKKTAMEKMRDYLKAEPDQVKTMEKELDTYLRTHEGWDAGWASEVKATKLEVDKLSVELNSLPTMR